MSKEQNKIREGQPADIHPDEINAKDPAKDLKAQQKTDIKESEIGRDIGQTPAEEQQIDNQISQIDAATIQHRKKSIDTNSTTSTDNK